MWNYKTPGIPDEYFERAEKVPITKEYFDWSNGENSGFL